MDWNEYGDKIKAYETEVLRQKRDRILSVIENLKTVDLFTNSKDYIRSINAYRDLAFQQRLEQRKAMAPLVQKIDALIQTRRLEYGKVWYNIYGYFLEDSRDNFNFNTQFVKLMGLKDISFMDVLNTKTLKQFELYLKDFLEQGDIKLKHLEDSLKIAHKKMVARKFFSCDIGYDLVLPFQWESVYDNLQKVTMLENELASRGVKVAKPSQKKSEGTEKTL